MGRVFSYSFLFDVSKETVIFIYVFYTNNNISIITISHTKMNFMTILNKKTETS